MKLTSIPPESMASIKASVSFERMQSINCRCDFSPALSRCLSRGKSGPEGPPLLLRPKADLPSKRRTRRRSTSRIESSAHLSSPLSAFSIASGNSDRSRSCVIEGEPLQRVDSRLIIVETEAQDFGSAAAIVVVVVFGGGVFGFPEDVETDVFGPAAFDNLQI